MARSARLSFPGPRLPGCCTPPRDPRIPRPPLAPQGRVTDHRVGLTEHGIDSVLAGERLDPFIEALQARLDSLLR